MKDSKADGALGMVGTIAMVMERGPQGGKKQETGKE